MKIKLNSIMVDDQDKALKFYTEMIGFVKKNDIRNGDFRWLTVISPEGPNDLELVLEPMGFPPAKVFQKALFEAGIPATALASDDVLSEYNRLKALGVKFRGEPTKMGTVIFVAFEDTCGNLINMYQA